MTYIIFYTQKLLPVKRRNLEKRTHEAIADSSQNPIKIKVAQNFSKIWLTAL